MLITRLLLVLENWDGKPTYRESWAGNLMMCSDLTLDPFPQGQTRIAKPKVLIARLLLVVQVWDGKPIYRKSWDKILLMWSDLTLDPSFKVKQG